MALPMKQASDLAKAMADKGIPGSITMAKPMNKMDEEDTDKDKSEPEDGTEAVCNDLADVLSDGDAAKKDKVMSLLGELVDRLKSEDADQDEDMGHESGSY